MHQLCGTIDCLTVLVYRKTEQYVYCPKRYIYLLFICYYGASDSTFNVDNVRLIHACIIIIIIIIITCTENTCRAVLKLPKRSEGLNALGKI